MISDGSVGKSEPAFRGADVLLVRCPFASIIEE